MSPKSSSPIDRVLRCRIGKASVAKARTAAKQAALDRNGRARGKRLVQPRPLTVAPSPPSPKGTPGKRRKSSEIEQGKTRSGLPFSQAEPWRDILANVGKIPFAMSGLDATLKCATKLDEKTGVLLRALANKVFESGWLNGWSNMVAAVACMWYSSTAMGHQENAGEVSRMLDVEVNAVRSAYCVLWQHSGELAETIENAGGNMQNVALPENKRGEKLFPPYEWEQEREPVSKTRNLLRRVRERGLSRLGRESFGGNEELDDEAAPQDEESVETDQNVMAELGPAMWEDATDPRERINVEEGKDDETESEDQRIQDLYDLFWRDGYDAGRNSSRPE